jgi:hypothetical protein
MGSIGVYQQLRHTTVSQGLSALTPDESEVWTGINCVPDFQEQNKVTLK